MQVQAKAAQMNKDMSQVSKQAQAAKPASPGQAQANQAGGANEEGAKPAGNNVSIYLKVVSKLENKLAKDDVSDDQLGVFTEAVKTRLGELNDKQKAEVNNLPEFKKLGIESLDNLPDQLSEALKDEESRSDAMALLKHAKFAELMDRKKDQASGTYSAQGMPAAKPNQSNAAQVVAGNSIAQAANQAQAAQPEPKADAPVQPNPTASPAQAAAAFKQGNPAIGGTKIAAA